MSDLIHVPQNTAVQMASRHIRRGGLSVTVGGAEACCWEGAMQKWEYLMLTADLRLYAKNRKGEWNDYPDFGKWSFSTLWNAPWRDRTTFDQITELGDQGWELIAVTHQIDSVLFTFKRPIPLQNQQPD